MTNAYLVGLPYIFMLEGAYDVKILSKSVKVTLKEMFKAVI